MLLPIQIKILYVQKFHKNITVLDYKISYVHFCEFTDQYLSSVHILIRYNIIRTRHVHVSRNVQKRVAYCYIRKAMPPLWRIVASFPKWWPGSGHTGFMVDNLALGQVFSDYFSFLCQSFHWLLHSHLHQSSCAGIIGQIVAHIPSRLSLTPPQGTMKKALHQKQDCKGGHIQAQIYIVPEPFLKKLFPMSKTVSNETHRKVSPYS
jgi:hypothetical protein